jgi:5-methyltetrahydrofolate--homocysteine methyltransferase
MQRRGMRMPLLIGGATTSRQHTAVRVAPAYEGTTVHVLDASRVVGVVSDLLDPERAEKLHESNLVEQQRLREQHEGRRQTVILPIEKARANREVVAFDDLPTPGFVGVRRTEPSLTELRDMIDWQFFFLAWELKGKYPAILDNPAARELFEDGTAMLEQVIAEGTMRAQGLYALWPARSDGDDIILTAEAGEVVFPMLRQQTAKPDGRANRFLADYIAPRGDHLGGFAVAIHGAEELAHRYEAAGDDYHAIMAKALADRLAEAFAEYLHLQVRRAWFEPDADPDIADLHAERFRGIRPALGYPASPDHSLKRTLFELLGSDTIGMGLTESCAMTPPSAVSGLIFAHPDSRYFTVGRIGADQAEDYAQRRGQTPDELKRWIGPNLSES